MLLKLLAKILSAISEKKVYVEGFYYYFFSREKKDLSSKYEDLFQELCSEVEKVGAIQSLGSSDP